MPVCVCPTRVAQASCLWLLTGWKPVPPVGRGTHSQEGGMTIMLRNVACRLSLPFKRSSRPIRLQRCPREVWHLRRRDGKERGVTVVEFTGLCVILVTLLLGTVEFARAWFFAHTVSHAAREGCRVAILPASTENDVLAAVARFINVPAGNVTMQNVGINANSGDETVVEVTYNFTVATGTLIPGFSGTIPIRGRAVMRHE